VTRIAVGILLASTALTSAGAAAGAQPRPAPSELWSRYPAGNERLQPPARARARPTVPNRPARPRRASRPATTAQRTPDERRRSGRWVVALVAAGVGVVAAVLLVRSRRRPGAGAAPPQTRGARLADDVRTQLADLLADVEPSARVPAAAAKRLGRESDTVPGEFPQGGSEILSSEPANLDHERNDLGSRVAGILEAAEDAAEQIRADARAMANQIEMSARSRVEALERETAPHEARLRRALAGLRELTSQLDELVGSRAAGEEPSDVEVLEERRRVPLG
jgi:hypothetical protein